MFRLTRQVAALVKDRQHYFWSRSPEGATGGGEVGYVRALHLFLYCHE